MASSRKRRSLVLQLFESHEKAGADIEALLRVTDHERLLEALSTEPDLVAAPDPARARIAAVGVAAGLDSDVIESALSVLDWLCRNSQDMEGKAFGGDLIRLGLGQPKKE